MFSNATQSGSRVEVSHLLAAVLVESSSIAGRKLVPGARTSGVFDKVSRTIGRVISGDAAAQLTDLNNTERLSPDIYRVLAYAREEAIKLGHKHIGTEHIALGLFQIEDDLIENLLRQSGFTVEELRIALTLRSVRHR